MTRRLPGLLELSDDTLRALRDVLVAAAPWEAPTARSLTWKVPSCTREAGEELAWLATEPQRAQALAALVTALLAEREQAARATALELVLTGPDDSGLVRDTAVVTRELFSTATRSVLVVGFAVHQGKEIFAALAERMDARPALDVVMCLDIRRPIGSSATDAAVVDAFSREFQRRHWPRGRLPRLYYDPRALSLAAEKRAALHAKCVVVDAERALVTSANFTEAAHQKNIEVGILTAVPRLASSLHAHFTALIDRGVLRSVA